MQKLYIPWSLKARFTTGKIYFLGAKPYLLKTNVWQGCPSGFSKCEFSHVQTWTHGHISTAAEPEDAGRCWCPQMSVAAPGPLPWLLCSCQSVRPALFRAWQLEPLLRMPSAGGHSPGGGGPWPTRAGTEMRKPSFFPWKSTNSEVWFWL